MKGDRGERKLVNKVEDDLGFYAQRTGASGGATSRNRPDVIMCKSGCLYFVELKTTDLPVRFKRQEVEDLIEAAERAGAIPVCMVWPDMRKHDQVHGFLPSELKENKKSFSTAGCEPGHSLSDLFGRDV